jgi:Kelch motif
MEVSALASRASTRLGAVTFGASYARVARTHSRRDGRFYRWLTALLAIAVLSFARDALAQSFVTTAPMATPRSFNPAALLSSGRVLVAGGYSFGNAIGSAEFYDTGTNTWSSAGTLASVRYWHTATVLTNGKVLVVGGFGDSGVLSSAELYDPVTNSWSPVGSLAVARYSHTATLLSSGKVLVAGGDGSDYVKSAELYDPATNTWSLVASLLSGRSAHTATLLTNGTVLVAGGYGLSADHLCSVRSAVYMTSACRAVMSPLTEEVTILRRGSRRA